MTTGGLTQARQRLGHEPVEEVFSQVAVPVATEDTPGAFLGPWRKMSMDGLEWDVPDTEANVAAFGFSGTGKDGSPAAFPRARAVTIGECASHAAVLAAIGPSCPRAAASSPWPASCTRELQPDWLLIADRNFYNWQDWCTAADTGAALLWRVKADLTLEPLEFYPGRLLPVSPGKPQGQGQGPGQDPPRPPAPGRTWTRKRPGTSASIEYEVPDREGDGKDEIIALITTILTSRTPPRPSSPRAYHERWEHETGNKQLKTYLRGPGKILQVRIAGHGAAGNLGLPAHPLRDQRPDLHSRHQRRHRPGPGQVQEDRPHHPPPGR